MKILARFVVLAFVLSGPATNSMGQGDPFGPPVMEANGWKLSEWFGWYYDQYYPFILHAQHDWLYASPSGSWVWLWDYGYNGWFSTSGSVYPILYESAGTTWLWYYEGTNGPRWYVDVTTSEVYVEYHGAVVPSMFRDLFEGATGLVSGGDDEPSAASEALEYVLLALAGDPATSTCPVILRSPDIIDILELPPNISLGLDFGTGCIPENSESTISGSISAMVTDILIGDTDITAGFNFTANELIADEVLLLDGMISGNLLVTAPEALNISVSVQIDNFQSVDQVINGLITLEGTIDNLDDPTEGEFTLTITDLTVGDYAIPEGTLSLVILDASNLSLLVDMETNEGDVNLEMTFALSEAGGVVINTVGTAQLLGETLTVTGLTLDPEICEANFIDGIITFSHGTSLYTITMSETCDPGFTISKQ